jgi:hypothetical protein
MGVAFALLAPATPRAMAALDQAGTRLDDLHSVVLHVVIRMKIRANLDAPGVSTWRIELITIVSIISGREFAEFGTVRPRVQIPGPRPNSEFTWSSAGTEILIAPL